VKVPKDADVMQRQDDLTAEYELRGIEAPYHDLKEEMDILTERAFGVAKHLTDERQDEIGGDILRDYLKALKNQQ
jgi:hypothetical protein